MSSAPPAGASGPVRVVIPVYDQADLLDVCGPAEMFHWARIETDSGWETEVVTQNPGAITFLNGFTFEVANDLTNVIPCDALWVPGAAPDVLHQLMFGQDRTLVDFLRRQAAVSRFVCSVCEGALLLAAAGLLDGYLATTHWAFVDYLRDNFPKVAIADGYPRFVVDRNRLTGGGISSALDEALELVKLLAGEAVARAVQQDTQYYPDPPVASSIPHVRGSPMPPPPSA